MAKYPGQKLKLLYLLQLLEDESAEDHPVSTARMIEYLSSKEIHADRKTIYDDMEALQTFGYEIIKNSTRNGGGYYLASRTFELPELKLLVDAVQSSRFITAKKSRELIEKLENMAGKRGDGRQLRRQVHVVGRIKTENESIYYSVDAIHRAIQENKQIEFEYLEWNVKKELVPRSEERRTVSPWTLIWQAENYYLVAYDSAADSMKHFRVDKMGKVKVTDLERTGQAYYEKLDLAVYANQTFGMYAGQEETVTLQFPNRLIGVVIDRFGKEAMIKPAGEEMFQVRAKISVSGQFFGWLSGLGKEAKILKPEGVCRQYRQWLADILEDFPNYSDDEC